MKYGIKLKDRFGKDFIFRLNTPTATINEFTGATSAKPLEFKTIGEAEIYAQNHELKNYEVVPL